MGMMFLYYISFSHIESPTLERSNTALSKYQFLATAGRQWATYHDTIQLNFPPRLLHTA